MKLSKLTTAVLAASLLTAGAVYAEGDDFGLKSSGSVAVTSDYKFRGISQTKTNAAVQGSLTLNHESGVYFTAWGSSVDLDLVGGLELDTLLGYAGSVGDVTYDVGVMRYNYPGANDRNIGASPDFNEVYGSVGYKGAKLGVAYSDDYYLESGKFTYVYGSYSTEVKGFGLMAQVGMAKFEDAAALGTAIAPGATVAGEDSYIDYKVAVTKPVAGLNLEVAYVGTDFDRDDFDGTGDYENTAKGSFVATVSKSF